MVIYTKLEIESVEYSDATQININKNMGDFNATSSFEIILPNDSGQYDDTFALNEEVKIYADLDVNPATTKIFLGIIENINFKGKANKEDIILSGRDYGAILQDILISPRIFKNQEASSIVRSLMTQNAAGTGITVDNVNSSGIAIDRITLNNISLFDSIKVEIINT